MTTELTATASDNGTRYAKQIMQLVTMGGFKKVEICGSDFSVKTSFFSCTIGEVDDSRIFLKTKSDKVSAHFSTETVYLVELSDDLKEITVFHHGEGMFIFTK